MYHLDPHCPAADLPPAFGDSLTAKRVELKYLVTVEVAAEIRRWAREHLQADPHADPALGDAYHVTTLYLDTIDWDIYHRRDEVVQGKHRIRRYGNEPRLWLERKLKSKDVVRKLRTSITSEITDGALDWSVSRPDGSAAADGQPAADQWFRDRVQQAQLRPATVIQYRRFARVGQSSRGPIRLTIDDAILAQPPAGWQLPAAATARSAGLLPDAQILELKFSDHLPSQFKQLLIEFSITLSQFSKYRTAIDAVVIE